MKEHLLYGSFMFRLLLTILFVFIWTVNSFAQHTVTGTVIDGSTDEPLPGVNIVVKGTIIGTATDMNGNYELNNVPSLQDTLVFTFIGYVAQEIPINGRNSINIQLQPTALVGEDIIVVGYGTQKLKDFTGSISSVGQEDFNKGSTNSFQQNMIGKSAGVNVTQASAEPGGSLDIQIRGTGSITASNQPLYVIDGVIIDENQGEISGGRGFPSRFTQRNPMSSLNPSDIESIQILKDASATAIYGARASNGVVLITTKRGRPGDIKINYEGITSFKTPLQQIDVLKPEDYQRILNNIIDEGGGGDPEQRVTEIQGNGTDWFDEVTENSMVQSHSLSLSGGNETMTYLVSLNYLNENGVLINSAFERLNARLNLDYIGSDKFNFGLRLTTSQTEDSFASRGQGGNESSGALGAALLYDPTLSVRDEDGNFNRSPFISTDNPVALAEGQRSQAQGFRTLGAVFGEYNLRPNWSVKVNFGTDLQNRRRDTFISTSTQEGARRGGVGSIGNIVDTNYTIDFTSSYNVSFENSSLSALGGFSFQRFIDQSNFAGATDFAAEELGTNSLRSGSRETFELSSSKTSSELVSYFSRINYNIDDKYLLTGSFRIDGSSKFGPNNKFGYFPSGAIAWRITNEKFMENVNIINELKLRLSAGLTGNDKIGVLQSNTSFAPGGPATLENEIFSTFQPSRLSNPDLKWEKNRQINVGFDVEVLSSRLSGTLNYFQKKTTDLLLDLPVPISSGNISRLSNVGSMKNTGVEMDLTSINVLNRSGGFNWTTSFNGTFLENEVLDIGGLSEIITGPESAGIIRKGDPVNSFFGFNIIGVWQIGDDFSSTDAPVQPGDLKIQDINGDGRITEDDRVILGDSFPDFQWGLSNSFSYKAFSLDVSIVGLHGFQIFNWNLWQTFLPTNFRRNKIAEPFLNRWTPENPTNKFPSFVSQPQGNIGVNSILVEDGSYVKLQNLTLGYTIPVRELTSAIENIDIYVSGQNLVTITNYSGVDPALNTFGNSSFRFDRQSFPASRTFSLGAKIDF